MNKSATIAAGLAFVDLAIPALVLARYDETLSSPTGNREQQAWCSPVPVRHACCGSGSVTFPRCVLTNK